MLRFLTVVVLLHSASAHAKLNVVATLPSLAAIAKDIGGEHVTVQALATPTEDPHYVDARPNLIVTLNKADLLIANGLELEVGWLPNLQVAARNSNITAGSKGYVEVATFVDKRDVPQTRIDRTMGDVHPGGNPHFLFDARAGAQIATGLGQRMGELDPANAQTYTKNAQALAATLTTFAQTTRERFAKLSTEQRNVVSYHRSFPYLYDWLGLTEAQTVEPRPGISPDPGHVAKVLTTMRTQHVHVIVQEEFQPTSTSKTLAQLAQGRVVTLPGGARFNQGQTYLAHLQELTEKLHDALAH